DETEAQLEHDVGDFGVLVEPGRQPQRVRKKPSEQGDSKLRVVGGRAGNKAPPAFRRAIVARWAASAGRARSAAVAISVNITRFFLADGCNFLWITYFRN